ncbi:MAG: acyl-CoA thioesterase [Spirochaetes bacterium]|nr:acyl-CoA thioesterase [Spirochaetota bacterium]
MKDAFRHKLFVRYFETDQMGFVYYSHYLVWFEAARTDFLRHKGFPYKKFEELGFFLPVTEAYCKYLSPAFYEDDIIVETHLEEIKNASLKISYRVIRGSDDQLLATGHTVHPCINKDKKIVPFPDQFRDILK